MYNVVHNAKLRIYLRIYDFRNDDTCADKSCLLGGRGSKTEHWAFRNRTYPHYTKYENVKQRTFWRILKIGNKTGGGGRLVVGRTLLQIEFWLLEGVSNIGADRAFLNFYVLDR